jgi:uncharacterized SAM-binding protein YcdF (DUF218 family)
VVEIGQRNDERDVVHVHELAQRRDICAVVDARDERVRVGVVERRSKRVHVDSKCARTGAAECGDDVDPLAGAGEENSEQRAAEGTVALLRRRVLIAFAMLIATWIVVSLVLFVWPSAETGPPRHADVVVVLSGATNRLPPAVALIRRGVAPVLAISSVGESPNWPLADRLCRAKRDGAAQVICFAAEPYSTKGEAETVAKLARTHGWRSIIVVSSSYHLTRAKLLFDRCFHGRISLVGVSSTWWRLPLEWATETGKLFVQLTAERGC